MAGAGFHPLQGRENRVVQGLSAMLNSGQEKTMTLAESVPGTESTVLYAAQGAVAVVTLNRPQALNSFSRQMHHDLWAALDRAEADPAIRALVITGAGRGFCAGADLSEFDFAPGPDLVERADPGPLIEQAFNPTARRLLALRMPTVAAVNGVAAGAGASLAMTCDMAVAAPGAGFIQAFSKIGLVPDAGGSWLLVQKLGLARAMGLALTGDKLTAAQAKEWGMVWDVADDPLAAAVALAQRLAVMPTRALVATRHLLREGITRTLDRQLDAERDQQSALARTHDYIEGVTAFLEKRPATFKGE
jgi:2-(1,2-epoxy-1,2-dihydrophenyl)acetyl-CoA isomerase